MRAPRISGFVITRATAYWVACEQCEESELVFGSDIEGDCAAWAHEHLRECPKAEACRRCDARQPYGTLDTDGLCPECAMATIAPR